MLTSRPFSAIQYIPGLDGLRAIAVLLVVLHHFVMPFSSEYWQHASTLPLVLVAKNGWVGVDIFFVISGYLITRLLVQRPITTWIHYRDFLIARAWRLIPAYAACLLVFSLVAGVCSPESKVLSNSWSLWTLTSNLQSAFGDRTALMDYRYSLVHFWSLAVEWHFYLLFAACLWLCKSPRTIAVALIIVSLACRYLLQTLHGADNALYAFSLCRFDAFAVGVLVAGVGQLSRRKACAALLVGLMTLAMTLTSLLFEPVSYKKVSWFQSYGYSLIALGAGMIILHVVHLSNSWVTRILETGWLVAIGRSSYSVYIWHLLFFPWLANTIYTSTLSPLNNALSIMLAASVLTCLLSWLSLHLIERPCYQYHRLHVMHKRTEH